MINTFLHKKIFPVSLNTILILFLNHAFLIQQAELDIFCILQLSLGLCAVNANFISMPMNLYSEKLKKLPKFVNRYQSIF